MYQQQCENTQHSEGKTSPMFCFLVIARQRNHQRLGINGSVPRPYDWHFSTSREYFALPRLDLLAFSLPFSSNYETQNFSPKVQLVVNIFQSLSPARIQTQSLLPRQRPEGVWQQELTHPCINQSCLLPPFKLHETLQPWNAMYTSKQQRRKLGHVIGVGTSTRLKFRAAKCTVFLCKWISYMRYSGPQWNEWKNFWSLKAGRILDIYGCSSKPQENTRMNAHRPWSELRFRRIVAFVHFWKSDSPPKNNVWEKTVH